MDIRKDLTEKQILELYDFYDKGFYHDTGTDIQRNRKRYKVRRRYLFCKWKILQNNNLL